VYKIAASTAQFVNCILLHAHLFIAVASSRSSTNKFYRAFIII